MTIDQTLKRDLLKSTTPADTSEKVTREDSQSDVANLDQHIVASSKQVLLKSIDFRPAEQDVSFQLQNLRVKYVALNPSTSGGGEDSQPLTNNNHSQMNGQVEVKQDGIPAPKKVLYPPEKIVLAWQRSQRVGPGLINMGNTCFLNATLQCLCYTPPLANYLLSHQHKTDCRELGFCIMCELCNHLHRAFSHQQNGQAIRPMVILHKLKHFAKHMHIGRQEDAHEFLRLLIEAMQKTCVNGFDKLDKYSKETSVVYQIFSGYYRSRVICSVCQNKSDTYEPFLDIGLDIKQAPTVTKALERLIRPEMLDGENLYQCKKCNRKVQAQKRFTVQRAPHVLTLCLKRFDFNRFSTGKINKELAYSDHLNLRPYMSDPKGPPIMYELYAVLKHEGASCNSGHYYCFIKAANQSWYCMNDAFVSQVSLQRVLNQNAYLLFYIRKSSFKSPMNGGEPKRDVVQNNRTKPATTISKPQSLFNGPVGTPVARPLGNPLHQKNPVFKPTMITEGKDNRPLKFNQNHQQQQEAKQNLPKLNPLPTQRSKLSFQFRNKSANLVTANSHPQPQQQQQQQPLLVKKQDTNATAAAAPVVNPVVTGAGDAPPKTQPEQTAAAKTFSPLQNQTSPPTIASSTTQSKDSLRHMQGLVKPKARLPQDASNMNGTCKKQPASSGLVPYTAEDSNSSSGESEMDYDGVVAQMSQGGDASNQSKNSNKKPQVKSEKVLGDVTISNDKSKENNVDATPMKPPAAAKSLSLESLQLSPNLLKKAGLANSTNLTSIRKPDSPLKLTITTNGQAQRIKSTSHWRAADSDSQISPSPASDCSLHSNVSTNSTSEWNTLEKKDAPQTPEDVKKEAAVFGWNISPAPLRNSETPQDSEEQRTKLIGPIKALVFDDVRDQGPDLKKVHDKQEQKKMVSGDKQKVSLKSESVSMVTENKSSTHKESKHQTVLEKSNLKDDGPQDTVHPKSSNEQTLNKDPKEGFEENTSPKKKKKRKKERSQPGSPQEPESSSKVSECKGRASSERAQVRDIEESSDRESEALKKHRKKKKKKKKKNKEKEEHEDGELVEEWVERVIEPPQNSHREPLLNNSKVSKSDSDRDYRDKHKTSPKSESSSREEMKHKHSPPHKDTKRKDKHSLMRRALEKKIKRHHERRASQKHKETHSNHDDHDVHEDSHHKANSNRDVPHNGDASHKHSKHHQETRKRHSSDDRSSSDHSTKVRRIDRDGSLSSHREKHIYEIDKSERHSRSSDNQSSSKHSKLYKEYKEQKPRGEDESSLQKEKKKKRKHRDEDLERRSLKDHNDEECKLEKRKKKKKKHSSSDDEEDRSSRVTSQKSRQDVPVQQWDHHIKDSHKKRDKGGEEESVSKSSKTHTSWDGTYSSSSVAQELGKSSLKAFGPSILSWDGGRSALDNEVDSDSRQNRQRDPYEEDFDRGKVKKVKKYLEEGKQKLFGGRKNPFQSLQTTRNRFEKDHHGYNRLSDSFGERPR